MDYRHELKFLVSDAEIESIRLRLKPLMHPDIHQREGIYTVRSLYFDDLYDSCMRENEDGVDSRSKYRIRIYDGDDAVIKLEKKIKFRGMTRKVEADISREDCLTYMSGGAPALREESLRLEKEFYVQIRAQGMRPASIVEYERTAFVEPRGNVRITFDRNISGCTKCRTFLDKKIGRVPLLPKGNHVLEVQYDELLPGYLSDVLDMGMLQRTSFSKYWYSRTYTNA